MTTSNAKPLPRYFLVGFEIGVCVYRDGEEIVGINHLGSPYPPIKALYEGKEITQDEFRALT
jgi:hypothetical protein